MRPSVALCLAGIAMATAARGQAAADTHGHTENDGPIPIRNMRPYNLLFLQFVPEGGDTISAGATRFRVQLDVANNLLIPARGSGAAVVEDNEYQRLGFSWRKGVGRRTEIGIFASIEWRDGGFMDPLLSGYHHLVGLNWAGSDNPAGRDFYPQFRSLLQLTDSSGNVLVNQGNAFGLAETSVTVKRALQASRRGALALRAGIKLPTGNPVLLLGSGSVDAGVSLDGRYSLAREIVGYVSVGGVVMGPAHHVPGARPNMLQAMVGIAYRPNSRDSFFLQVDGNSPAVRTGNSFADRVATTATFGYKRVLDRRLTLFASFSENGDIHNYSLPYFSDIAPDFTISTGLEWRR